jgi:adenylate cyclase
VERLGRWIWEHRRERFIVAVGVASVLVLHIGLVAPVVVICFLYLDLGVAASLGWFGSLVLINCSAMAITSVRLRHSTDPIRRWAIGDDADPVAAWSALVRLPQQVAWGFFLLLLPLHFATSFPLLLALIDPGPAAVLGLVVGYPVVIGSSGALIATIAQLLVRAAVFEIGGRAPSLPRQTGGAWTVRRRLVIVTFMVDAVVAVAGPLLVLGSAADQRDFLVAVLGGTVLSGYVCWMLDAGLFRPTIAPVSDLIDGTVRVRRGDLAIPVLVSSLDELGDLAFAFNAMQQGLREREALQEAFGSYVDPLLAQRLVESGSAVFDGEDLVVTVLFADVRDFTSYAEGVSPAAAVERLNRLFDVMVPVLHDHGGHANHYLGDGLLAVFGAPQPLERHADSAVAAAVEMQQRVRVEFGAELRLGIGINTGPVIAGTVGGGGRHEFTVIGDTVNAAARVEQLTKDTGDAILITEATRTALSAPRPRTTRRGEFEVRGKATKLTLHAVDPFPRSTR